MIIQPGPENAVTFTDDTSPNLQNEPERRVSIHAQVVRSDELGWFFEILSLYRDIAGELKSDKVLANFPNLPKSKQGYIWEGLKNVRIHVVDTLPYHAPWAKDLKEIAGRDDAMDMLKDRARKGEDSAKQLLKFMDEFMTKMVVDCSPAKQFMAMASFMRYRPGSLGWYRFNAHNARDMDSMFDISLDSLSPDVFITKNRSEVGRSVKWTSKSAPVFTYAMDNLFEQGWYGDSFYHQLKVFRSLKPSHAFDKGDDKAVLWIDRSRQEVVNILAPQVTLYLPKGLNPLYGDVSSDQSFFTQASDIAAGFARQLYEQEGIVSLSGRFEYVTFNGVRISRSDAEETMREWSQMGYINRKEKTIYIS
jgi:hypothetical protein